MPFRQAGYQRVALAVALIIAIALLDWRVDAPIAFGFMYLFPILIDGGACSRLRSRAAGSGNGRICTGWNANRPRGAKPKSNSRF